MISNCIRNVMLSLLLVAAVSTETYSQINTDRVMSIGKNALYFEDYVLAIQYFNQVIGAKPYLAEPYFCRAVAKINLEDYVGAEADCDKALERNPFIVRAYHCRGIARVNQGKSAEAMEDFDKGLELDEKNQSLILCKGIVCLHEKKYSDARKYFDLAIKHHSKDAQAYLYRSRSFLFEEDTNNAMKDADKAVSLDKYSPDALATRALIFFEEKNYEKALRDMDEAIRLSSPRQDLFVNRALMRYHNMEIRGAMDDYDNAISLDPDNTLARFNRGLLRLEVGDYNNAEEDFNRVLMFEPDNQLALFNRAIILTKIGKNAQAIKDFTTLINENPDYAPLYYARAEAKRQNLDFNGAQLDQNAAFVVEQKNKKQRNKKQNDESEKTRKKSDNNIRKYNKLVAADPSEAEKRISYRTEYRGKVQNVNTDITLEPDFILSYYKPVNRVGANAFTSYLQYFNKDYNVGQELIITNEEKKLGTSQLAEHFKSIDAWTDSLNAKLTHTALFARSLDFYYVGDYERALEDANALITSDSKTSLFYFYRANIYMKKAMFSINQTDENSELTDLARLSIYSMAEADLNRCIELFPNFEYAHYNLANIQIIKKNYSQALAMYDEAIRLDDKFAEAYYNRGITQIYLGNRQKGILDLSKAGELGIYKAYNVIKRYSE